MYLYGIFDRKLKEYSPQLMMERNDFGIMRGVADGLKAAPSSLMAIHPEDFDLMKVGEFNRETGEIVAQVPVLVENLQALVSSVSLGGLSLAKEA